VLIGVIDTGINPWHSHVRGGVFGCNLYLDVDGRIREDGDFRDLVGHGTAVAGVLREQLPDDEIFVARAFDRGFTSYPSLVARGILRAAAEGCRVLNMSLGMPACPGAEVLADACAAAREAGCTIVAAGKPHCPGLLPASLPGVIGVIADDRLSVDEIEVEPGRPYPYAASGRPRELRGFAPAANLWGNSFACARVTAHLVRQLARDLSAASRA
jgi:subtilisin family serine protease